MSASSWSIYYLSTSERQESSSGTEQWEKTKSSGQRLQCSVDVGDMDNT